MLTHRSRSAQQDGRNAEAASATRLLDEVGATAVSVSATVVGLVGAAAALDARCTTADAEAQAVAAASEQVSTTIGSLASAAEELSTSLREVSARTAQAAHAVQGAVANAEQASRSMAALEVLAHDIADVSNLIAQVARQTNLLALNATIEAARAGEAGKGFAVVAREVKELSNETAEATTKIDERVRALLDGTAAVTTGISETALLVEEIGQMTSTVAASVEEQTTVTAQIARDVAEGAGAVSDVSRRLSSLSGAVGAARGEAARVRRLNGHLQEEAAGLDGGLQAYFGRGVRTVPGTGTADRLTAAIEAHGAWKVRLMEAVATGRSPHEPAVVSADDRCAFGTWLHGEIRADARGSVHYAPVLDLHAQFHRLAGRILTQARSGERHAAASATAFGGELDQLLARLIGEVNEWRDELAGTA